MVVVDAFVMEIWNEKWWWRWWSIPPYEQIEIVEVSVSTRICSPDVNPRFT